MVTRRSALVETESVSLAEQTPATQFGSVLLFTTVDGGAIVATLVTVVWADAADEKRNRNSKANVASNARDVSSVS